MRALSLLLCIFLLSQAAKSERYKNKWEKEKYRDDDDDDDYEGEDYFLGNLLLPKDVKGVLNLLNFVVPGVKNLEKELSAVLIMIEPLINKAPGVLEKLTPTVTEIAESVWAKKEATEDEILKWAKALVDKEYKQEWIRVLIKPEIETLLDKAAELKLSELSFFKPIKGLIKGVEENYKKIINAIKKVAEKYVT